MLPSSEWLGERLAQLGIDYISYEHVPLANCTVAKEIGLEREGVGLKNLFLRDNYGKRHFLVITLADKQLDLKALSKQQGVSRLGFCSSERLEKYLKVKPGSVSALATLNDEHKQVELWLDGELRQAKQWQCHPFENDKTWVITLEDLKAFWRNSGHEPSWVTLPERKLSNVK
ncbi:prolyl-tRNA synthetase associated domain-containing protein [Pseudoalteromonas luteoviolacea]|uniref:prolyl-tRNA synthetase associated domain-containing protein n=1 Tax=Pseudoalteromonas luteoviolacea TaxID=43657 RepID=UPI00061D17E1|nr:prolyl-tRNA synthetase associated domain-containing protein [Pseudoalteromonas luteoviolacea]AOT10157.1 Ala-tRNA(Pro) hydrolase [Pseudoalteromonas luteoviolacea]AOT15068.1 Ala-tRNA(Pro) hydrolase [Pseudoalteromonas luteoviolacea]AOT19984.1 Ala-tRNA(Pro) hydrolase [Pseudoalteromonas luteoviolacea]